MRCSSCSHELIPVVALDIDGTLADYHGSFLTFLTLYLNASARDTTHWFHYSGKGEFSDHIGIDKRLYQEAKLAFRAGGYKRWMRPLPQLDMIIGACAGAEVWITTTRPWMRMDNVDPDTREWLRRNGVQFQGLLYDEDKYAELLERVDRERIVAILEDQADQYDRATELGLPVLLRGTQWNASVQIGREAVSGTWAAVQIEVRIADWRTEHGRD